MSNSVDILRFTTAGSVDDGKSTLIGRLLYDSKGIFIDQLEDLKKATTKDDIENLDLARLTDGLKAEREQGITIDVAYRYFSTPKRKFIIADTPGHIEYTRNMFTGASNSELAIILIDSRKGILEQSKRHLYISYLLGIENIIVAINKMDLVDYKEEIYQEIKESFLEITKNLSIKNIKFVPISALSGDMVVNKGRNMNWYKGETLIEILENAKVSLNKARKSLVRFPVQLVSRVDDENVKDFRGYMGQLSSGEISVGDQVVIYPNMKTTFVKSLINSSKYVNKISINDSATILLEDELDISRGDLIASDKEPPNVKDLITSQICWMGEKDLDLKKKYFLKHCNKTSKAIVTKVNSKINMESLERTLEFDNLKMNDIGEVEIRIQNQITYDSYQDNKKMGSFILIDDSNNTVAAGIIT
ncbi:MAG: GTP-binding protein [Thermodesulfobacteriota bacteirum]|nr:GTP-binding protein [Thermodesulfobacteriota bacterium]